MGLPHTFFFNIYFIHSYLKQGSWCLSICQAALHARLWSQNCGIPSAFVAVNSYSLLVDSICLISLKKKLDGAICLYMCMDGWDCAGASQQLQLQMGRQFSCWYQLLECCTGKGIPWQSAMDSASGVAQFCSAHRKGVLNSLPLLERWGLLKPSVLDDGVTLLENRKLFRCHL